MLEPLELIALIEKFAPKGAGKAAALKAAIRRGVTQHALHPGDTLPSTRRTAAALAMSRNSVIEAYEGLQAEGVIETRRGARPKVCALPSLGAGRPQAGAPITLSKRGRVLSDHNRAGYTIGQVEAFQPGLPDPKLFPRDDWATCLRRAARRDLRGSDQYEHYQGLPDLREAIALHLRRARGVAVAPEQVFILPNTQSGMALLAELVTDPGDTVLMEDPCYVGAKALFEAKGLQTSALPPQFPPTAAQPQPDAPVPLIYVTPSTQYPTGVRMQLRRRLDVLDLAARQSALVIEDDYDGDFVWRGADVPPLFALDKAASVALLGTLSKSIMPGMRVGWLVVPPAIAQDVAHAHRTLGLSVNTSVQAALADFIISGLFARHLRSAARQYQERMTCLTDAMFHTLGNAANVSLPDGGLQVLLRFAEGVDDTRVAALVAQRGFDLVALSRLCIDRTERGLVIGFARATPKATAKLAAAIRDSLREVGAL
jgi:GntR family transcriptional regulator/MocR family aminotransferase